MVARIAAAIGLLSACVGAGTGLYALGSVGEAPISNVSDMGVSGAMWQAGAQAEMTAELLFAFAKVSGGAYLRTYSAEALVEIFNRVFAGWEGRNSGLPWWKLEIGWRLL